MEHESGLFMLKNTFARLRIMVNLLNRAELEKRQESLGNEQDFNSALSSELFATILQKIKEKTLFSLTDKFGLNYKFLLIKRDNFAHVLLIGPFLHHSPSPNDLLLIAEKNDMLPKYNNLLAEYMSIVPIIDTESHLFTMLEVFCESLWGQEYHHESILKNSFLVHENINALLAKHSEELNNQSMHVQKQKYEFENQMLNMVQLGQIHKLKARFASISDITLKKRLSDYLRDIKNYCIIANTLLRKAAERGGVHPYYLDITSSNFAVRIESTKSSTECTNLIKQMFFAYCQLVVDFSTQKYSPVVESSIIYIMNNLSESLSLSVVAKAQNVSKQYLSAVFKRDTQKTITQFITEKRIEHAVTLLTTTKLKIETISQHCGILDLQYFCKLFKKITGKSPKEYR